MDLLGHMAVFVRIVEAGSLSAVARELRTSLSAVSRHLRALEEEVGAALAQRSTRHLRITDEGRRFYARCLVVLREVEGARESVHPEGLRGTVRMSASVTFGRMRLGPLLPTLVAQHPALRVELRLEDHVIDLLEEDVDAVVRVGAAPPDSTSVIARRLMEFRRVLCAAPSYLRRRGAPKDVDELAAHVALAHLRIGSVIPWRFEGEGGLVEIQPAGPLASNNVIQLRDWALAGVGIALLPDWLVAAEVARGELAVVLEGLHTPPVPVHALFHADARGVSRIRVLLDHLAERLSA